MTTKKLVVLIFAFVSAVTTTGCGVWETVFGGKSQGVVVGPGQLEEGCAAPRPAGSACDAQHLCPVDQYCSCAGECQAMGPAGPGATGDMCVKASALVQPLLADVSCSDSVACPSGLQCVEGRCSRRCEWDDQCPWGSYCQRSSGYCKADCLEGITACSGLGETCGCDGKCKVTDKINARQFELITDPSSLTIPTGSAAWSRTIQVGFKTKDETLLTGTGITRTATAMIDIAAGQNLKVDCDPTDNSDSSEARCSVPASWSFRFQGDSWVALKTIAIKGASIVQESGAEGWSIRLASKEAGWQPRFVRVDPVAPLEDATWTQLLDVATNMSPPATALTVGKRYAGTATIRSDIDRVNVPNILEPSSVAIPIEAVVESCGQGGVCLSLYDAAGALSATRVLQLPVTGAPTSTFWRTNVEDVLGERFDTQPTLQAMTASSRLVRLKSQSATGALWGTAQSNTRWDVSHSAAIADITFTLSPTDQLACSDTRKCVAGKSCVSNQCLACVVNSDCASGDVCHAGFCEKSISQDPENSVLPPHGLSYRVFHPYNYVAGINFPTPPNPYSSTDGLFKEGGMDTVAAYRFPDRVMQVRGDWPTMGFGSLVSKFENHMLSLEAGVPIDTDIRDLNGSFVCEPGCLSSFITQNNVLPCVAPLNVGEAWPSGTGRVATCDVLFDRIRRSDPELVAVSFSDFCQASPAQMQVRNTSTGQQVLKRIWTCKDWEKPYAFGDRSTALLRSRTYAERFICSGGSSPILSGTFGGFGASGSGDLECRFGSMGSFAHAFPFIFAKDTDDASKDRASLLRDCLNDLHRSSARYPQKKSCVIEDTILGAASASSSGEDKQFHLRLVQQWFELASFVGATAFEELRLQDTDSAKSSLPSGTSTSTPTPPKAIDRDHAIHVLANTLASGVQMLGPNLEATLSTSNAADPDYRSEDGEPDDEHEQPYGPAPVMLEAATNYLQLVELYLEQEQLATYAESVEGKSPAALAAANDYALEAVKLAELVARQSAIIYQKISASQPCDEQTEASVCPGACIMDASGAGRCKEAFWVERWRKSRDSYLDARARLTAKATTRRNPLGVDEDDLPLFFGDLQGTNSRFFAASDYLMNTWALSAVASAQGALATARDAWVAERDKQVANQDRAEERSRRLTNINKQYAAPIIDACGLPPSLSEITVIGKYARSGIPSDCYIDRELVEVKEGKSTLICTKEMEAIGNGMGNPGSNQLTPAQECVQAKLDGPIFDEIRASGADRRDWIRPIGISTKSTPFGDIKVPLIARLPYQCIDHFIRNPPPEGSTSKPTVLVGLGVPFIDGETTKVFPSSKACEFDSGLSFYKHDTLDRALCNAENGYSYDRLPPAGFTKSLVPENPQFPQKVWLLPVGQAGTSLHYGFKWKERREWSYASGFKRSSFVTEHAMVKSKNGGSTALYLAPRSWSEKDANSPGRKIFDGPGSFDDVTDVWIPRQLTELNGSGPSNLPSRLREAVEEVSCDPNFFRMMKEEFTAALAKNGPLPGRENAEIVCAKEKSEGKKDGITSTALSASCYRGQLGRAYLDVIAAKQDVDLARKRWQAEQEQYRIRTKGCLIIEGASAESAEATKSFNSEMDELGTAYVAASAVSGLIGAFTQNPSAIMSGPLALLQEAMARTQRQHEAVLMAIQSKKDLLLCLNELEAQRAVFAVQQGEIVRRTTDAMKALVAMEDVRRAADRSLKDGLRALELEAKKGAQSLHAGYWYQEKAERYLREFKWAKRLTFLVLRAVEYEFQQSFPLRNEILSAKHPDQLEAALRTMQREVATRAVNRRRPEEQSVVLSLRDDILGIRDKSAAPIGERLMTPAQIISGRLWDPKYAVYDNAGKWLGQGIPFNFKEYGTLENRCAERVWRVNATIQGDGLSEKAPGAPIMLLKRNTFQSQWCEGRGDGTEYQVGHLQPSRNLFLDSRQDTEASQSNAYGVASIFPWFNVRRADFFKDQFVDGSSEELAGRGMYGDYLLLFPRQLLTGAVFPNPADASLGDLPPSKFPLERVEDVLLRFDYLSVDNFPGVGPTFATTNKESKAN